MPFDECNAQYNGDDGEKKKRRERKERRWLRPYQEENATSRLISEAKPLWAQIVLGLETTWELWVL